MRKPIWNPYLAGALAGVLLVLSVLVAGHFLGASTTFARSAAAIEKAVGMDPAAFEYFTTQKGIIIGAFIASKLSGEFKVQMVPDMWQAKLGSNAVKRGIVAFIGGVIGIVGARLAGG